MKCSFGDCWEVRYLVWNMPADSKRGLDHVMFFHEVCALVAHK